MKRILIAGASGMIGQLILQEALSSSRISQVISLVRKPSGIQHDQLTEVAVTDFTNYDSIQQYFKDIDAAYFCIGVYTGQVPDKQFKEITVDYAVAFAKAIHNHSPMARLCLLSGAGADRTEKSRTSFARYKGMAENAIAQLDLEFYTFRPGYIYPTTPRDEPSLMYKWMRKCYPLIKLLGKNASITSTQLAYAMLVTGMDGADKEILENKDIIHRSTL